MIQKSLKQKLLLGVAAILILGGAGSAWKWNSMNAHFAARSLKSATTDEARIAQAQRLMAMGEAGQAELIPILRSDDASQCAALQQAFQETPATALHANIFKEFGTFSACGQDAVLAWAATIPDDSELALQRQTVIREALSSEQSAVCISAIKLVLKHEPSLKPEIVGKLNHASAEVRRAAMMAVGPHDGKSTPVIADDELFRWLHDADWEVRTLCEASLAGRGLDAEQVNFARKSSHPEASERLSLLNDLGRYRNPSAWLQRLSQDPDPAVRAGAARLGYECRLTFTTWIDRMIQDDPDANVRTIAAFYRERADEVSERRGISPR